MYALYRIPVHPCDLLYGGDRYIEAEECAYPGSSTLGYPRLRVLERDLLTECPFTALASVSMVGYLNILLRSRMNRHVPEPHAVVATDMDRTIAEGACHILCPSAALEMEKPVFPVFCYFSAYIFVGLK